MDEFISRRDFAIARTAAPRTAVRAAMQKCLHIIEILHNSKAFLRANAFLVTKANFHMAPNF